MGTPHLNAKVIEEAAAELTRQADLLPWKGATVGALVGALFGGFPLTPLGHAWPIPSSFGFATLLLGAVAGAVVGYVVGEGRSRGLRVRAQTTLTQAFLVRHAAATQRELHQLMEQLKPEDAAGAAAQHAAASAQAPAPAPAPAVAPAPQAPAPAPQLQPPAPQPQLQQPPTLRSVPPEPPVVPAAAGQGGPPLSPPVSH